MSQEVDEMVDVEDIRKRLAQWYLIADVFSEYVNSDDVEAMLDEIVSLRERVESADVEMASVMTALADQFSADEWLDEYQEVPDERAIALNKLIRQAESYVAKRAAAATDETGA